jgi:hypothetical protein
MIILDLGTKIVVRVSNDRTATDPSQLLISLKIEKENHKKPGTMPPRLFYLLPFVFLSSASTAFLSKSTFLSKQEMRITRGTPRALVPDFLSVPIEPIVTTAATFLDFNPEVKAEVLTDVSHVALDFSCFLTPSKSLYLVFAVVGRMLLLYNDWCVPGHSVPPEELAIQVFLLGATLKDLVRAAVSDQQA